jgi:SOS-response transcriptional repressor LexA
MTLGQKIEELLRANHMTKVALAKEIGLADSSVITHWVRDRHKPDWQNVEKIARVFRKPIAYFADDAAAAVADAAVGYGATIKRVPVVGVVGAGEFMFNFDDPPLETLPTLIEGSASRRYAAFRIRGDCMEPRFHDGEIVIVGESETVPDGVPGVFRLDGSCTLKVPVRHSDHVELKPLNPRFKSIDVRTNKLTVVGVVVGVWRKP